MHLLRPVTPVLLAVLSACSAQSTAEEAARYGLINKVVPKASILGL